MASRRNEISPVAGGVNQLPQGAPIKAGWRKSHRKTVLPVFGKRSVDNHLAAEDSAGFDVHLLDRLIEEEEEKHFRRHHRQTRHNLYGKIETYLNS